MHRKAVAELPRGAECILARKGDANACSFVHH
jgi:hypothetical protein